MSGNRRNQSLQQLRQELRTVLRKHDALVQSDPVGGVTALIAEANALCDRANVRDEMFVAMLFNAAEDGRAALELDLNVIDAGEGRYVLDIGDGGVAFLGFEEYNENGVPPESDLPDGVSPDGSLDPEFVRESDDDDGGGG